MTQPNLPPVMAACLAQLDAYFKGEGREFSFKLEPAGTDFQKAVWRQLLTIPYGQTASYLDVARQVSNEKAVRAVGAANGQNPIAIIVPCHRVIGSNGQLTGYGGGLWRKAWLLNHEKKFSGQQMALF
ncbi:MAG: methylated-DNA--[protein]-cysteine S-methyltransferase [Anaerolineae bacterium]|nr:methylated-DNA--[protein]-cysteine S-methyltransferase [Anaerolineae bacterium]